MQPSSKKGPSWANESQALPPVARELEADIQEDAGDEGGKEEGVSDLDWMKKHMTKDNENLDGKEENAIDQSNQQVRFYTCSVFPIHEHLTLYSTRTLTLSTKTSNH
jgi:hypothetical protein